MNQRAGMDYVTVVSGLPRSGTSMMMRMLGAGGMSLLVDEQRASDTDNPLGYFEYEPVKRMDRDHAWFPQAAGKAVKIIHMLLPSIPPGHPCRIVFMKRDLSEVVASQAVMLERRGQAGAGVGTDELVRIFRQQLDSTRAWVTSRPELSLLEVSYSETVADPGPTVEALRSFLAPAKLDRESMRAAIDPKLYRQRGPRQPGSDDNCRSVWRHEE